jgi:hypothetical protein
MPKKPRRGKVFQSKKKRARQPAVTRPAEPTAVAVQEDTRAVPTPAAGAVMKAKSAIVKYPYVKAELRRIGLLAGAVAVILVVLALVL